MALRGSSGTATTQTPAAGNLSLSTTLPCTRVPRELMPTPALAPPNAIASTSSAETVNSFRAKLGFPSQTLP